MEASPVLRVLNGVCADMEATGALFTWRGGVFRPFDFPGVTGAVAVTALTSNATLTNFDEKRAFRSS